MICQRCGKCCSYFVLVGSTDGKTRAKPDGMLCPHLAWEGSQAVCRAHEEPWFEGSPCDVYGNSKHDPDYFGSEGRACRVGVTTMAAGGLQKTCPSLFSCRLSLEELEVVEDE